MKLGAVVPRAQQVAAASMQYAVQGLPFFEHHIDELAQLDVRDPDDIRRVGWNASSRLLALQYHRAAQFQLRQLCSVRLDSRRQRSCNLIVAAKDCAQVATELQRCELENRGRRRTNECLT